MFGLFRRLFQTQPVQQLARLEPGQARLVVGLGNPGPEYALTRHNIGFRVIEEIARRRGAGWAPVAHTNSLVAVTEDGLVIAKPQTFMNRSGDAVRTLIERLHIGPERCLIVYDDMDLPFEALRLRERGSPGTHNGMRSVVSALGTDDVPRLRVGIGQAQPGAATDHVLSEFDGRDEMAVTELIQHAADACLDWAFEGATVAMNRHNSSTRVS